MKYLTTVLFILSVFFFASCSKDKIEVVTPSMTILEEACVDVPLPVGIIFGTPYQYQWKKELPYYDYPCFNPNNPNELVFRLYQTRGDSLSKMVKYDLSTHEIEVIHEGFFFRPRWSIKDWIIFSSLSDKNIYKIKSNGDSLTQLTFTEGCLGADWNQEGNKFVFTKSSSISILSDEQGGLLDTIPKMGSATSWQHPSLLLTPNYYGAALLAPGAGDYIYINDGGEGTTGISSAEWLDDDDIIKGNNEGVFSINVVDETFTQIIESCDSRLYRYPTVSKLSQKIVFQRRDRDAIPTEVNKGTESSTIFMMNFDGTEKEELVLPE